MGFQAYLLILFHYCVFKVNVLSNNVLHEGNNCLFSQFVVDPGT